MAVGFVVMTNKRLDPQQVRRLLQNDSRVGDLYQDPINPVVSEFHIHIETPVMVDLLSINEFRFVNSDFMQLNIGRSTVMDIERMYKRHYLVHQFLCVSKLHGVALGFR